MSIPTLDYAPDHSVEELNGRPYTLDDAGAVIWLSDATRSNEKPDPWPQLDPAALYGLPGELVRTIEPHTEADPVALLLSFLTAVGCAVGPGPHAVAGAAVHGPRLFYVAAGDTSKARKGTSLAAVRPVLAHADPTFARTRIQGGFGSGEVVIDAVNNEDGDQRLLIQEEEFARILRVSGRDGSILSMIVRNSWDGRPLEARSRGTGNTVADRHHIAVLGHITMEELRARLTDTEIASGFANRFLFAAVRRSKRLPAGGDIEDRLVIGLGKKTAIAIRRAKKLRRMQRSEDAEKRWADLYDSMADDEPGGLLGALIARDAPQCLRLSVIYAMLDGSKTIETPHLEAAWAVWQYCRASAAYIFGDSLGDEIADRLLKELKRAGVSGLTFDQQSGIFSRNVQAKRLQQAREYLERRGDAVTKTVTGDGRGRPATVTYAATKETK